jgi:uncharacterized membrane protein (DUF485 family)
MQLKKHSLIESITNIAIGYGVALLSQIVFFPMVGVKASMGQNITIGLIFTAVSLVRSYVLRRIFTHLTERHQQQQRLF